MKHRILFITIFSMLTLITHSEAELLRLVFNNLKPSCGDTIHITLVLPGIALHTTTGNYSASAEAPEVQSLPLKKDDTDCRHVFSLVENTGLGGYFNMHQTFIPGEITLGVTSSFDVRVDHYFHLGTEYMLLWGKPDTTDEARFIMNANIRLRVSVPVHPKVAIEALMIGGVSMWPKADTSSVIEPTFYEDRFGWNFQPALGIDFGLNNHWSISTTVGYLANTTVLDEIYITHDMLLLSIGPRLRF